MNAERESQTSIAGVVGAGGSHTCVAWYAGIEKCLQ